MSKIKLEKFSDIIKKAQTDKITLLALKNVAVKCQDFELASHLREVENELFPEPLEHKLLKKEAAKIRSLLSMVGLDATEDTCWIVREALREFADKQGEFTVDDGVRLMFKRDDIFGK